MDDLDGLIARIDTTLRRKNTVDPRRTIEVVSDDGRWRVVEVTQANGRRFRVHSEHIAHRKANDRHPPGDWIEYLEQ